MAVPPLGCLRHTNEDARKHAATGSPLFGSKAEILLNIATAPFGFVHRCNVDSYAHEAISASFLGPMAENHDILRTRFKEIIDSVLASRSDYFPGDLTFIPEEIKSTAGYVDQLHKLDGYLEFLNQILADHTVPFFSPRFNGHMNSDISIPAILGYVSAVCWNQNNATPEAGPMTSYIEYLVGQQLCRLLGYRLPSPGDSPDTVIGWGHVTCDGTVANLESMWIARNFKFYPLSLSLAITEGDLSFVGLSFTLTLHDGSSVLYKDCDPWVLVNLPVDTILDLPARLTKQYGISPTFIDKALEKYHIHKTGKEYLQKRFGINPPVYLVSITNHYSWPKSAAITAIGTENLVEVSVDDNARLDITDLERKLECFLNPKDPQDRRAVYAVVAICGSTEHGAVDPVAQMVDIRSSYEKRGLSFYVHVDAAWGGYFASMLDFVQFGVISTSTQEQTVPQLPLSEYTIKQLLAIHRADSTTIDPHKSGYVPYPAGALCYRNERLRYLVTMTAPYINTEASLENMGTYGLEGSKPGTSPVAVWLSHLVIGLDRSGYGSLLGEAAFTGVKMYCNWATLDLITNPLTKPAYIEDPDLIARTFVMLPSEREGTDFLAEKLEILNRIVTRSNEDILSDALAMKMISKLGSDLIINVFACNFKITNAHGGSIPNRSVADANFLNSRLFDRMSISKYQDRTGDKNFIITSTVLSQEKYGEPLRKFKARLGLDPNDPADLVALSSTSMSPFPTAHNFIRELVEEFRIIAREEIKNCRRRVEVGPTSHGFIMQGTDVLYLAYLPMFNVGSHRQQLIITGELPTEVMQLYVDERRKDSEKVFTLHTEIAKLADILERKSCKVSITVDLPVVLGVGLSGSPLCLATTNLTNIRVLKNRSIAPESLDPSYPTFFPFYLYGTSQQQHIDHILLHGQNVQLCSNQVTLLSAAGAAVDLVNDLAEGLIAVADSTREKAQQPFTTNHQPCFFRRENPIHVKVYKDPRKYDVSGSGLLDDLGDCIAEGFLTLRHGIYIDYTHINQVQLNASSILPPDGDLDSSILNHEDLVSAFSHQPRAVIHKVHETIAGLLPEEVATKLKETGCSIIPGLEERPGGILLSRFVVHEPTSTQGRNLLLRKGFREILDKELSKRNLPLIA